MRLGPALLLLLACGTNEPARIELLLGAASDLAPVLPELTAAFEAETGIHVVTTIGSSGALAAQILNGAPIDVFASADGERTDQVAGAGRMVVGTRATYAYGRLALYVSSAEPPIASIDELRAPAITRIAIANPESAPYGLAAKRALERAGLWTRLQEKIVIAENVRQTLQYVESGGADAALTSLSLVRGATGSVTVIPDSLHGPLEQVLGVIAGTEHESEARALADFLTRGAGRDILRRHSFELPDTVRR
ncbi:MAG: molybdate ABC transporter substrate-binding protein [Gemmatimonadetes bacterium]|nr:molybdate ABC transporter substrate-binding protein [Gemmatimonadota bacterium]